MGNHPVLVGGTQMWHYHCSGKHGHERNPATLELSEELHLHIQVMALDVGYQGNFFFGVARYTVPCYTMIIAQETAAAVEVLVIGIFHGQKESDKWIFLTYHQVLRLRGLTAAPQAKAGPSRKIKV